MKDAFGGRREEGDQMEKKSPGDLGVNFRSFSICAFKGCWEEWPQTLAQDGPRLSLPAREELLPLSNVGTVASLHRSFGSNFKIVCLLPGMNMASSQMDNHGEKG